VSEVTEPVTVIGSGAVGQSAALLLARWDVPVLLLDRRPERDLVGSRSICQHRDVLDVWASVGAGERIAEEGVTWTTARTYFRDRELFSLTLSDRGRSPFPPFVNISQSRTEQLLDVRIAAQPLIRSRWSTEVVGIDQDDAGVMLTCATPKGRTTVRTPYALACAGARGDAVRQQLGVRFDGHAFDDQFLICDIQAELPGWERERRFYFDPAWNPGRQVLIHPCPDSTYRIDWQVPPGYDLDEEERSGALDARIRKIVGDLPYRVVWRSVYRFQSGCVDRMRAGRVLLAGDCAHLYAPFGARGLNSGVQDAENAAWKLAFVLRGWAPDRLLDSYHHERHAAALENLEVTSATMRFLVPQSEAEWGHRRGTLERAVHDPAAHALVDSGRLAEPFWYVGSPLTTGDPSRPFPGRPPKGETPPAVPGVLVPDAPVQVPDRPGVTRLREVVRDGLLALTTDGVDVGAVAVAMKEATAAPSRVLRLADLDTDGALAAAMAPRPREAWIVRPDGHLAAVVPDPSQPAVAAATRRAVGNAGDSAS
jgi:2-polyprenyl-6-methoxyphenol hydroxylase-like FAD-dependent oxidoreductase